MGPYGKHFFVLMQTCDNEEFLALQSFQLNACIERNICIEVLQCIVHLLVVNCGESIRTVIVWFPFFPLVWSVSNQCIPAAVSARFATYVYCLQEALGSGRC